MASVPRIERAHESPRFLVRRDAPDRSAKVSATTPPTSARLAPTVAHEAVREARRAEMVITAKSTLAVVIQRRPATAGVRTRERKEGASVARDGSGTRLP